MGKVTTTLTITNWADQVRASDGAISPDQVRSVTLDNVLVDTGATMLCLPSNVIARLGLQAREEVGVETATGLARTRIFEGAKISVCGREGLFDCLELPGGLHPILGVVPLEVLGLEPDLKNQRLRVLPMNSSDTYLTIL